MIEHDINFLNQKYCLLNELSHGEFGKVFKAKHKLSYEEVVIKIEKKSDVGLLLYETKMYNYLKNYPFISKLRNFYNYLDYNILIIDYNGETIFQIKNSISDYNSREKINLINKIIIELIEALKQLHELNYIYRDVKPQNFCFKNSIKLIDLGFCFPFIENHVHIKNEKKKNIIGTPNYISKNIIDLNTPSRRDDIESLIYIYLFLICPSIIWDNYNNISLIEKKNIELLYKILESVNKDYYENEINIINLINYLKDIRLTNFDEKPNYKTFKNYINLI